MTAAASFEPAAPATVGKHPCPECGGNLEWHPQAQTLRCPYCGTEYRLKAGETLSHGH